MKNDSFNPDSVLTTETLRQRAETMAQEKNDSFSHELKSLSPEQLQKQLHELHVHQIELEMQNEELRRTQVELDATRARYFDLYDLAPIGYCSLNKQGVILEANLTAAVLLGLPRGALLSQPISHFILLEDQDIYYLHRKLLFDSCSSQSCELRMMKGNGAIFWAHITATIKTTSDALPICRIVISDITERKHSETELLKMQNLTSIGTLAGGIAHDFNNILMGVFGTLSLAKHELPKDHPAFKLLEYTGKSMDRAIRLTKQLLTFAKGGEPVKESLCLGTVVREVAEFDLSGSNILLVYKQAPDLRDANVDKGQIQQVISNLTINAREAMPNGGHLFITLENSDITEDTIPHLHQGHYIKISVQDEGSGIDPKHIDRIFDPYFTTKQTGSGLGLATSYSIIQKHGGHISAESVLGNGATFTLYLPVSNAHRPAPEIPQKIETCIFEPCRKILVLDDEEFIRMVIPRWLRKMKCLVETSHDGRQTIELYHHAMKSGTPFDLLILDLTVPGGIGGREVLKEILVLDPNAKAIVSSGYAEDPVMANYTQYGFKGVLAKPYTENQLQELVAKVLS
ncbi:MAG: ATP-binding protein [bacterium]|jgi:two-component system cell cycle sensor histidine kinase/response regulator CckA